ncbi:hypothetical protein F5148DRAFT_1283889 [Russula earlei]|uniref:Uncharacterized protein n=1 Tax=Russula earlei TaxID=71964 RepID=A0ACC0UBX0_9AGAM|nr:hypothetical protein F5148DRAFT_1283889 [Russula earlei]
MSVSSRVDLEAGSVSERSRGCAKPDDEMLDFTGCHPGSGGGDAPETRPTQSEHHVMFESWKGSSESILFGVLFVATVSMFVIENYNKLSPDVTDHAVALFDQNSQRLVVVIPGDMSVGPSLPFSLDAMPFGEQPSPVAYVLCIFGQQWWLQDVDPLKQNRLPDTPARVSHSLLSTVERFATVLSETSIFLFVIGLVDFILPISNTIGWMLLGYLTSFASLYAATLLPWHIPGSHFFTLFPNQAQMSS